MAGTDWGSPAETQPLRARFVLCSPTWLTHPPMTSSIRSGSTPVRSINVVKAKPEEVRRVPVGQRATPLAERRPHDVDDDRLSHGCASSSVVLEVTPCQPEPADRRLVRPRLRPTAAASSRRAISVSTAAPAPAGLALVGDAAVVEHDGPVGQLEHPVDLLLDHDQRGAVAVDLPEPVVDLVDDDRGQAQGQLVGHQDLGRHHQHLGQREQPLLATRERAGHWRRRSPRMGKAV